MRLAPPGEGNLTLEHGSWQIKTQSFAMNLTDSTEKLKTAVKLPLATNQELPHTLFKVEYSIQGG